MAFYPQFPAIYAYPMPFPNQEFYAMYPPGSEGGPMYYEHPPHGNNKNGGGSHPPSAKHGFNNRKDSADSGISDFSVLSSRKTSSTSTISNSSMMLEESNLEDVKEEVPFEEPDDDLCEKIVQQVEFYFSDANITKDKFLLKHVKRNKEGFVSLKLISSFKRVKHLTKDWRQVAHAIERKSDRLEVNDVKTKVRRLESLPEYDETTPSRTVVALNLPLERPTIEAVAEIFSACGDIVLIRILRPGNPVPADIKPFVNKHPEMTAKVCALVEFERTEFALKAVKELDNEEEEKMKVMELTAPPPKSTKKDDKKKSMKLQHHQGHFQQQIASGPQRRFSHAGFNPPPHHQQPNPDQMVLGPRRRISLYHNMKFSPISEEQQKKDQALNPNAPTFTMQQRRISRPPFMHPAAAMEAAAQAAAQAAAMQIHPAPMAAPAWMLRRLSGMHGQGEMAASGLALPPNVVRMPRGPDKGKGFQKWCRNRMDTGAPAQAAAAPAAPQKKTSHAVPIVAPPKEEEEKKQVEAEKQKDEAEEVAVPAPEAVVDGAAALPDGAAALPAVPAPVAAAVVVEEEDPAAIAAAAADSCSDSGNEDGSISETELEAAAVDNERSR